MGATFAGRSRFAPMAAICNTPTPAAKPNFPQELETKLIENDAKYQTLTRAAEKNLSAADEIEKTTAISPACRSHISGLAQIIPNATHVGTQLRFLARFHKTLDGSPATEECAKETIESAKAVMQDMFDSMRCLKAMLPRPVRS